MNFSSLEIAQALVAFPNTQVKYVCENAWVRSMQAFPTMAEMALETTRHTLVNTDGSVLNPGDDGNWTAIRACYLPHYTQKVSPPPPVFAIFGIPALRGYFATGQATYAGYESIGVVSDDFFTAANIIEPSSKTRISLQTSADVREAKAYMVETLNTIFEDLLAESDVDLNAVVWRLMSASYHTQKPFLKMAINKLLRTPLGCEESFHSFLIEQQQKVEAQHRADAVKQTEMAAKLSYKKACTPYAQATVAELAQRLNVSKNQVKAWKTEGVLDQEIAKQTNA